MRARAFTLVELVVTLAIVGIIAAVAFPQLTSASSAASDAQVKATLNAALDASSDAFARASVTAPLVYEGNGYRPPAPDVSLQSLRSNSPTLQVAAGPDQPSTDAKTASVAARFLTTEGYWRVGAAALAAPTEQDADSSVCWMAWRDLNPTVTFQPKIAAGPIVETYFTLPAGNAQACTGQNATYAQIPASALESGSTEGKNWNNPIALELPPGSGSDSADSPTISYANTAFTQNSSGIAQVLTPTTSNLPAGATFALSGTLPTYADGTDAVSFSTSDGSFTSPALWPYTFFDVDTNGSASCAITSERSKVLCWGQGTTVPFSIPGILEGTSALPTQVSVGAGPAPFACLRYSDATARCFGDGTAGQLGNSTNDPSATLNVPPVWVQDPDGIAKLTGVVSVAAGYQYACAALSSGEVYCWGDAPGLASASNRPTKVDGLAQVTWVEASDYSPATTCALHSTSELSCWGNNASGQAGQGSAASTLPPGKVIAFPVGCEWVSEGGDGVTTCGPDYYGGPLSVPLTSVASMSIGKDHVCAVTRSGVRCWGSTTTNRSVLGGARNPSGSGNVTAPNQYVRELGPGAQATSVAVGSAHACVRYTYSQAACWGSAAQGALGNEETSGTTISPSEVVKSNGVSLKPVVELAAGTDTTCATTDSGELWCFGTSEQGATGFTGTLPYAVNPAFSGTITGFPASVNVQVLDSQGFSVASVPVVLTRP